MHFSAWPWPIEPKSCLHTDCVRSTQILSRSHECARAIRPETAARRLGLPGALARVCGRDGKPWSAAAGSGGGSEALSLGMAPVGVSEPSCMTAGCGCGRR